MTGLFFNQFKFTNTKIDEQIDEYSLMKRSIEEDQHSSMNGIPWKPRIEKKGVIKAEWAFNRGGKMRWEILCWPPITLNHCVSYASTPLLFNNYILSNNQIAALRIVHLLNIFCFFSSSKWFYYKWIKTLKRTTPVEGTR